VLKFKRKFRRLKVKYIHLHWKILHPPCSWSGYGPGTTGSVPQKVNWPKRQGEPAFPVSGEVKMLVTVSSPAQYLYTPLLLNGHSDGVICCAVVPYSTACRSPVRMRCKQHERGGKQKLRSSEDKHWSGSNNNFIRCTSLRQFHFQNCITPYARRNTTKLWVYYLWSDVLVKRASSSY
jgi:hypothetical protein